MYTKDKQLNFPEERERVAFYGEWIFIAAVTSWKNDATMGNDVTMSAPLRA